MKFTLANTSHNTWAITWDDLSPLWYSTIKFKLMATIFNETGVDDEAALAVLLNNGETTNYWVSNLDYFQDKMDRWERYAERYQVGGVVFRNKDEAERFKSIMEQKVTWALLKDGK